MSKSTLNQRIMKAIQDGIGKEYDDLKSGFRDALTDMMHIAQRNDLDFDERLEGAREVFDEESETRQSPKN